MRALALVMLIGGSAHAAIGTLDKLELRGLDVTVDVHGDVAQTRVEHDFYNDSDERLEGTFRFPLPIGAEITGLAMEVDGRMVEGELLERKKAERIFDQIVDEMRDPALLTWEAGQLFKLRVFPIEPNSHKRVVIRYLAPLEGARYLFAAPTHLPHFRLTVDGKTVRDQKGFRPETLVIDVADHRVSASSLREVIDGTTYLRLKLPVETDHRPRARGHLRWVLVVDVSRSALEARPLTLDAVRTALAALPEGDSFQVLACDIQCRASGDSFTPVTPGATAQAIGFLTSIEFDGATDLGMALGLAAARARGEGGQVLYFGDGHATWGNTDPGALAALLGPAFAEVPFHAVVLGKMAHPALLTTLSNRGGGLSTAPTLKSDLLALGAALRDFGRVARIFDISLSVDGGAQIAPSRPASIGAGEPLTVFVRSEKGQPPPRQVKLRALVSGKLIEKVIPIAQGISTPDVAHRFAAARIHELELTDASDPQVLALSLEHKVLSSKTAWLVLENDEAYRRHQIARNHKEKSNDPAISGKDLASSDGQAQVMDGEGPEPELWLLVGLMLVAYFVRARVTASDR